MALSRVTPTGWLEETGNLSRVTPTGWVQETQSPTADPRYATLDATLGNALGTADGDLYIQAQTTAALDATTLVAQGVLRIAGTLDQTLGAATLAAQGNLIAAGTGTVSQTLDPATLSAQAKLRIAGALTRTLDDATLAASGSISTVTRTATLDTTLESATLAATGKLRLGASVSATLEAVQASGAAQILISGLLAGQLEDATLVARGRFNLFSTAQLAEILAYMEANMPVPTASEIATAVWSHVARTVTNNPDIAAAVLAAAQASPIHANMVRTNSVGIQGDGTANDKFRSVLID